LFGPRLYALFQWQTWAVFRRNAQVYLRNWKTAFFPPAMEPVIFFVAFGLGLGTYVGSLLYEGTEVGYSSYVAPGLVAYTAFSTPFFEALYSSYVRMFYQKTWDGILSTQVEIEHIVWAELTWAGARGMLNSVIVVLVLSVFQAVGLIDVHWQFFVLLPPLAFAAGWVFGAFGLIFTALVPSIDHMNYPVFLIGVPLGLVSNTYFPLQTDVLALKVLMNLNPVYHLAETFRSLLLSGSLNLHALWLLLSAMGYLWLFGAIAQPLIKRRVLGE